MAEQATKEPTMEEILSSIRRIISEDGNPVEEASGGDISVADADDDFDGLGDDLAGMIDGQANVADDEHMLSVDDLLDTESEFTDFESLADIDALGHAPEAALQEVFDASALDDSVAEIEANVFTEDAAGGVPSTHAEAEAAIAQVTAAADTTQAHPAPEAVMAAPQPTAQEAAPVAEPTSTIGATATSFAAANVPGNPIENMVSEMMRPMIKEWIDTNLPGIVERKVEAEIQQVANRVVAALRND